VNKKVIIGIVIAVVIGIGVIALAQVSQDDQVVVSDTAGIQREPQSFTVGLQESVGVSEVP
jgi:hypothetical protein